MNRSRVRLLAALMVAGLTFGTVPASTQSAPPLFVGMGDSIGEAVQSADASIYTQAFSYLNLVAAMMGAPFPLPLIKTNPFGLVGGVVGRARFDPAVEGLNLSVSGANTYDLLFTRADATSPAAIDSETDLVLYPRQASQMEIVEALQPQRVAVWIGSNDALGAVTDYDNLDGVSQLTSVAEFSANFAQVAARLAAVGSKVVFGTIPDVSKVAYLLDNDDLIRLLGTDYGLPAGSRTSLVVAVALRNGTDPIILQNPDYVLDAAESAHISERIAAFNQIIKATAAKYGMGVADTAAIFNSLATNPPSVFGVPFGPRYLGGVFSLDGVHPGNFAQALVAQAFIRAFNTRYGLGIPTIPTNALLHLFVNDPFIDKDGDGRVKGRPGAGLIETAAALIGWSGDSND